MTAVGADGPGFWRSIWHAAGVNVAPFFDTVPAGLRLLMSIGITVGVSLLFAKLFYSRSLMLAQNPADSQDAAAEKVPHISDLSGKLLTFSNFVFVFLLGFTLGQFWSNDSDAQSAYNSFANDFTRVVIAAKDIPADQGGDTLMAAINDYRTSVLNDEWPLLAASDNYGASQVQIQAGTTLIKTITDVGASGANKLPSWDFLNSSLNDLGDSASQVIDAVPGSNTWRITALIMLLGVINLALIAIFQPTRRGAYYLIVGLLSGMTGLLFFILVEVSNPFTGSNAIVPHLMAVPGFS